MENRTVQEFVEDMVSDGRNLNQILIVAANSRWVNVKEDIKRVYRELRN